MPVSLTEASVLDWLCLEQSLAHLGAGTLVND